MWKHSVLRAMELAAAAYNDIQPEPPLASQSYTSCENGVQYFTRLTAGTLDIVFRGSNTRQDWRHNLSIIRREVPYGGTNPKIRVHGGFLSAYKSAQVRDALLEQAKHAAKIRVSGHSYGAALAVLCALDLQYNYPKRDIEAYLFGCPRVGNRAFARSYNKRVVKTIRVENGCDIVTCVPPAIFGFRHVGARFHVGRAKLPWRLSGHDHRQAQYYQSLLNRLLI